MIWDSNTEDILSKIEKQTSLLRMNTKDVAALADILHVSYIGNFRKVKTPMFTDLYKISLAIGMPIDQILDPESKTPEENPLNILHWFKGYEDKLHQSSFIAAIEDKVAVAGFMNSLQQRINETNDLQDILRLEIIRKLLLLNEADFLFVANNIADLMPYLRENEPAYKTKTNLYSVWNSMKDLPKSVWHPKNTVAHFLWETVERKLPDFYQNRTQFLRASGISTKSYNEYKNGESVSSSPTTDTTIKVCNLLSIDSLDEAVRGNMAALPEKSEFAIRDANGAIKPYSISIPGIKEHLKTLPSLAIYIDQVLSLNANDLHFIHQIISEAIEHPFASYCYTDLNNRDKS